MCYFTVENQINTGIDTIYSIASLRGKVGVILGDEGGVRKLKSYNLQTGQEVTYIDYHAWDITKVMLQNRRSLAVAYELVWLFRSI